MTNPRGWNSRLQDGGACQLLNSIATTDVALADFNGDGRTDLAINAPGTDAPYTWGISIWLGHPDGTFGPPVSYPVCYTHWGISAGDLNGDGYPDVVTGVCDDGSLNVLMNRGDGTGSMQAAVEAKFSVSLSGERFPLRDFDGNGTLDVVLAGNDAYFLEGLGDGGFAEPVGYPYSGDTSPNAVKVIAEGAFRAGGALDFVVADDASDQLSVYLGNGGGLFLAQPPITGVGATLGVAVGDFDGDGRADIASGGFGTPLGLLILLGNGDGTFSPPNAYPDAGEGFVALADLDRDGRAEALVATYQPMDALSVVWHLVDGGTTITSIPLAASPHGIVAGDLNDDGATDVAVCMGSQVHLFLNGCP